MLEIEYFGPAPDRPGLYLYVPDYSKGYPYRLTANGKRVLERMLSKAYDYRLVRAEWKELEDGKWVLSKALVVPVDPEPFAVTGESHIHGTVSGFFMHVHFNKGYGRT
jgi:hypothetical protein